MKFLSRKRHHISPENRPLSPESLISSPISSALPHITTAIHTHTHTLEKSFAFFCAPPSNISASPHPSSTTSALNNNADTILASNVLTVSCNRPIGKNKKFKKSFSVPINYNKTFLSFKKELKIRFFPNFQTLILSKTVFLKTKFRASPSCSQSSTLLNVLTLRPQLRRAGIDRLLPSRILHFGG